MKFTKLASNMFIAQEENHEPTLSRIFYKKTGKIYDINAVTNM